METITTRMLSAYVQQVRVCKTIQQNILLDDLLKCNRKLMKLTLTQLGSKIIFSCLCFNRNAFRVFLRDQSNI